MCVLNGTLCAPWTTYAVCTLDTRWTRLPAAVTKGIERIRVYRLHFGFAALFKLREASSYKKIQTPQPHTLRPDSASLLSAQGQEADTTLTTTFYFTLVASNKYCAAQTGKGIEFESLIGFVVLPEKLRLNCSCIPLVPRALRCVLDGSCRQMLTLVTKRTWATTRPRRASSSTATRSATF